MPPWSRAAPAAARSGWISDEIQTAAGTTVDDGQNRPTRSTCSTPFCSAHTTVRSLHSRANQAPACSFWVSLTAMNSTSTGPSTSAGSVFTGPGSTIGSLSSGRTSIDSRAVCPHTRTE
jgi:ATP-dependent phosphoenolpyruvate carboxykinase